jgi:CheY-like chemotaxis protein
MANIFLPDFWAEKTCNLIALTGESHFPSHCPQLAPLGTGMIDPQKFARAGGLPPSNASPSASSAPQQDGPVVLVVEDDGPVRHMLAQALPTYGYQVELAATGAEAVKIYQQKHVDFVLLDVQMPGMDGPTTLEALRHINAEVLCCFMTGWPGKYTGSALPDLNVAGVIQKPFSLFDLSQLIAQALSARRDRREK